MYNLQSLIKNLYYLWTAQTFTKQFPFKICSPKPSSVPVFVAPAAGSCSFVVVVSISLTHIIRPSRRRTMLLGNLSRTSNPLNRSVENCGLFFTFRRKKCRGSASVWFLIMNCSADSVLPNSSISGSSPFGSFVGRRYNALSANRFLKYELYFYFTYVLNSVLMAMYFETHMYIRRVFFEIEYIAWLYIGSKPIYN